MAEQASQPRQAPAKRSSTKIPVITTTLKVVGKIMSVCLLAGLISLLCEFTLYAFRDDAINESLARYEAASAFTTANWLNEESIAKSIEKRIVDGLALQENTDRLKALSDKLAYHTGQNRALGQLNETLREYTLKGILAIPDVFSIWIIATFTWIAKMLSITALTLPCLIIVGGGFVDGSVQRKIDTFRGTRDSQDKIEWWFLMFKSSSYTVIFLYIAIPNTFQAATLMLPAAVMSSYFIRNVVANYKKYW